MSNSNSGNEIKMILLLIIGLFLTFLLLGGLTFYSCGKGIEKAEDDYYSKKSSQRAAAQEKNGGVPVRQPGYYGSCD